jgi:hypothetical protein
VSPVPPIRTGRSKKALTGPTDETVAQSASADAQQAPADAGKAKSPARPTAQARTASAGRKSGALAEPTPAVESTGSRGRKGTSAAGVPKTGPAEVPPSRLAAPREVRQPKLPEAAPVMKSPSARRRGSSAPAPVVETLPPGKASSAASTAESRASRGTKGTPKASKPESGANTSGDVPATQATSLSKATDEKTASRERRTAPDASGANSPLPATARKRSPETENLDQAPHDALPGKVDTADGGTPSSTEGPVGQRGAARGVRQVPKRKRTGE